jgi:hypothetical protein
VEIKFWTPHAIDATWSPRRYNRKEILQDYTATADATYGDPAVCSPPVIQHVDDGTRNDHGHCGRDYREQVLCDVKLVKP